MHDNADYGKPVGDALRTTSIEAATDAILLLTRATADAGPPPLPFEIVSAEAATDAVLGVAMHSIRRDALGEAIALVEALPADEILDRWKRSDGFIHRYHAEIARGEDVQGLALLDLAQLVQAELLGRLRGLRDTQAPSG